MSLINPFACFLTTPIYPTANQTLAQLADPIPSEDGDLDMPILDQQATNDTTGTPFDQGPLFFPYEAPTLKGRAEVWDAQFHEGGEFQVFDRAGYNEDPSEAEPNVSETEPRSERKRGRDEEENPSEVSIKEQEDRPRVKRRKGNEEAVDDVSSEEEILEDCEHVTKAQCLNYLERALRKDLSCNVNEIVKKLQTYDGCPSASTLARFATSYRDQAGMERLYVPKTNAKVNDLWVTVGIPAIKKNNWITASKVIQLMQKHTKRIIPKKVIENKVTRYRKAHDIKSFKVAQLEFIDRVKQTQLPALLDQDLTIEELRQEIIRLNPTEKSLVPEKQSIKKMIERPSVEKKPQKKIANRGLTKRVFMEEIVPQLGTASIPALFKKMQANHPNELDQLPSLRDLQRKAESWLAQNPDK